MRRIAFSIAVFRKKLSVQSTPTSTKSRWKFYTQVGHRSFHTAWVKSGPDGPEVQLPLYPRKRTQLGHCAMSEMCQQQTFGHAATIKQFDTSFAHPTPNQISAKKIVNTDIAVE